MTSPDHGPASATLAKVLVRKRTSQNAYTNLEITLVMITHYWLEHT